MAELHLLHVRADIAPEVDGADAQIKVERFLVVAGPVAPYQDYHTVIGPDGNGIVR